MLLLAVFDRISSQKSVIISLTRISLHCVSPLVFARGVHRPSGRNAGGGGVAASCIQVAQRRKNRK